MARASAPGASGRSATNHAGVTPTAAARAAKRALSGTVLDAVVNADGTLARGRGVLSAAAQASAIYVVIFRYNIRSCAYVATIGLSGSTGFADFGEVTTVGQAGEPRGVFLTTADSAGRYSPRGFHLVVVC